jgi:AraC family transcriptional regulator
MESQALNLKSARSLQQGAIPFPFTSVTVEGQATTFPDVYSINVNTCGHRESFSPPALQELMINIPVRGKGLRTGRIGALKGRFIHAQPGAGLSLIPAGMDSEWQINGDNSCSILFLSQALVATLATSTLDFDATRIELIPSLFFTDPLIFNLGTTISQCMSSKDPFDLLYLESLSQTLTMHLLRHYSFTPPSKFTLKGKLSGRNLKKIMDYVVSQPLDYLRIQDLAKLVNLSPFHFERMFKTAVGKTVHQFVLEHQLKKSLNLLMKSDLTIAQIAAEIGFADQAHFDRQFKAAFGIAPSELRKDSKLYQSSQHENTSN